jgi:lipopolysaccharide export system protein LptC
MSRALAWLLALWRDAAHSFSLYLPIIVMALLALGTYWLVRSTPSIALPDLASAPKHEPDYFMHQFAVKTFDAKGILQSEVLGSELRHYPDTQVIEVDKARIQSFKDGRLTTATAERALSNADGSEVQLMGNALVVREPFKNPQGEQVPRLEFRGEFLHAFLDSERVKSHKPVTLKRGNDQFTAERLDYDNAQRSVNLQGRVRGVIGAAP